MACNGSTLTARRRATCSLSKQATLDGVLMSKNAGSAANRNLPDVSAVATNLSVAVTNPATGVQTTNSGANGSSAAAPLWTAFVALAKQQAQSSPIGIGAVENANAFLYSLGKTRPPMVRASMALQVATTMELAKVRRAHPQLCPRLRFKS